MGGYVQCPKCSTPWIAGFCRARLVGCPRSARSIKNILKKERKHPKKLSSLEKMRLTSFQKKQNILEVLCLVCKWKKKEFFCVPVKDKAVIHSEPEKVKRKKKKKSVKEVNAGLHLMASQVKPSVLKDFRSVSSAQKPVSQEHKGSVSSGDTSRNVGDEATEKFHVDTRERKVFLPRSMMANTIKRRQKNLIDSQTGSSSGSAATSVFQKTLAPKEKQEKQKKITKLKTAMVKDIIKDKGRNHNNSLSEFLNTLF